MRKTDLLAQLLHLEGIKEGYQNEELNIRALEAEKSVINLKRGKLLLATGDPLAVGAEIAAADAAIPVLQARITQAKARNAEVSDTATARAYELAGKVREALEERATSMVRPRLQALADMLNESNPEDHVCFTDKEFSEAGTDGLWDRGFHSWKDDQIRIPVFHREVLAGLGRVWRDLPTGEFRRDKGTGFVSSIIEKVNAALMLIPNDAPTAEGSAAPV